MNLPGRIAPGSSAEQGFARKSAGRCLVICCICAVGVAASKVSIARCAQGQDDRSLLSEQVELARLLDLCAQRLRLNIEYDPAIVKGTITFRFTDAVNDDQLWVLTNRLLAAHGLTTVRMAGERTLSVVKLSDAAGQARIEDGDLEDAVPGFVRVLRHVTNRSTKDIVPAIQLVLSKPGGSISPAEGSDVLVIADLKPQLMKALEVLEALDSPRDASVIQEVEAKHVVATELVALVDRVLTTQTGIDPSASTGRLIATPDEKRVLVIAAPAVLPRILDLLDRFDRREAQSTVTYAPKSFGVKEVGRLIEATLAGPARTAGSPALRMVTDDLTGTLLLTATASQHAQVAALIERLDSAATGARRPIRSFKLKNRPVSEVLSLLQSLIAAGAIQTSTTPEKPSTTPAASPIEPEAAAPVPAAPLDARGDTYSTNPPAHPSVSDVKVQGVTTPELSLSADEGTNTLIAVGDGRVLDQIDRLLKDLDVRQPQVMLEALVLAISESDAVDLGVELQKLGVKDDVVGRLSSLFGLQSPDPSGIALPAPSGVGFHGVVLDPGSFSAIVRALETLNEGRTLTIPRVLVNNNQQGRLDSVLQTPFTSTNASNTVATTSFGGTVDAGTTITMKPQIAEGDHLLLEYDVSVSSFVGDSSDPTLPPPRQQNKVASSVTIPDGYTVVVGGLKIDSETESISRVPWLGEIPILGWLFQNRSSTKSTTRLYVFLHADVMRGLGFEYLKHLSNVAKEEGVLDDGCPRVEPRFIR